MFQKKYLYYALPAIILSTLLVVTIIFAWTDPEVSPPLGNVDVPINIGSEPQGKMGALGIGIVSPAHKLHVVGGNIYASDNVWDGCIDMNVKMGSTLFF